MVRLVATLVVLVIVLIVYFIRWLVDKTTSPPSVRMQSFNQGQWPGQQPGGMGYGGPARPGLPPGGYQQGPSGAPQQGPFGAPQQGPYGVPQQGPSAWPPQGVPGVPATASVRLVARPEHGFDRLSDCMSRAGLRVAAPPGVQVMPGEPSNALWQNEM